MPPNPKIGNIIQGKNSRYEIVREITQGNMAWALEARAIDDLDGKKVFLKYYKSPTPTVDWYHDYISYVDEINRRLAESDAAQYCVLSTDLFTANPKPGKCHSEFLYQTFDFIENGYDLRGLLDNKGGTPWEKRVTMAKIFLVAMRKIHDAGVVHCDLKPENIQMLPKSSTKVGMIPRMIDMDRSILSYKAAPWTTGSQKEGYTGTPGYLSPEHLKGEKPREKSDVFTIGIILAELLGHGHPYGSSVQSPETYKKAVLNGRFTRVQTEQRLPGFEELLNRCFAPNINDRPTSAELHKALLAAGSSDGAPIPAPPSAPEPPPALPVNTHVALRLKGNIGELVQRFSMDFGKHSLSSISSDATYCSRSCQFRLEYDSNAKEWYIIPPNKELTNLTALNKKVFTNKTKLSEGDVICLVGKGDSGKSAMELYVSFIS